MTGTIPAPPDLVGCVREMASILNERSRLIGAVIAVLIDHESGKSVRSETVEIIPSVKLVLPLMLQAAISSTGTVITLSRDVTFSVRDCYSISRSIFELALNICFILTDKGELAEKAIRHANQKSYRDTQRESKIGGSIIALKSAKSFDPATTPGLAEALAEFQSRSGREKMDWADESIDERIAAVGQRFGDDLLTQLHFARFMIYRYSSDVLHGTFFSALYFFGRTTGAQTLDESAKNIGDQHINLLLACGFALEAIVKSFHLAYGFQWGIDRSKELNRVMSELPYLAREANPAGPPEKL